MKKASILLAHCLPAFLFAGCTLVFAESDPEAMTDEKLRRKGWHRKRGVELRDGQPGYVWWVYSRQCKAGEKFGYHTEKYAAPFLLVR